MKWFSFLVLFCCSVAVAAEPPPKVDPTTTVKLTPGKPMSVNVGKKCVLTIETTAKKVTWIVPAGADALAIDGKRLAVWADTGIYKFVAQVPSGDDVLSTEVVLTVVGPRPTPIPPGPTPPNPPDPPTPTPVAKTFHVIWVIESGSTPPLGQLAVVDGKVVRDYLNEKTNPEQQWSGWRRFDPQQEATNETPFIKALWADVKPKITNVPCVVIEVDGKATIHDIPKTPADAIALFKSKNGGR